MKKIISLLIALAMVVAMLVVPASATNSGDTVLVEEFTYTETGWTPYETTIVLEEACTLTANFAGEKGFYLYVEEDGNWSNNAEQYSAETSGVLTMDLAAGTYLVIAGPYDSLYGGHDNGDVTFSLTCNGAGYVQEGGVAEDIYAILGENELFYEGLEPSTATWTSMEAGTLTITITDASMGGSYMGAYIGNVFMQNTICVNNTPISELTTTVELGEWENVAITAMNNMGADGSIVFTLSFEAGAGSGSGGGSGSGDTDPEGSMNNPFTIDALPYTIDIFGGMDEYYNYTPTEDGLIKANTTDGMYLSVSIEDWTENDGYYYVSVTAGEQVTLNPWNMDPTMTGEMTFEFMPGATLGDISPEGSMSNPYVISVLPYTADLAVPADPGYLDVYYSYVPAENGQVQITVPEAFYFYSDSVYEGEGTNYTVDVTAGVEVILNVYTYDAGASGEANFTFVPGGQGGGETGGPSTPVASATDASATVDAPIAIPYTPDENGILTVVASGNPGYQIVVQELASEATVGLPETGSAEATFQYELVAGTEYTIYIKGYNAAAWAAADAIVSYDISFGAQGGIGSLEELDISDVELTTGDNDVALLPTAITTLYIFTPAEPGVYTITVPAGMTVATYGYSSWAVLAEGENGVLVHTATDAEQTVLVGVSGAATAVINIEKTGDYTPGGSNEYIAYEATNELVSDFTDPTDLVNLDITVEQTVVLGNDGYYHLGTADGPLVYVNLNNECFTLAMLYSAGAPTAMRGIYDDGTGDLKYYDFISMIGGDYYTYSQDNDYHPLNTDLMVFLKAYGASQGWYNPNLSGFEAISGGQFEEDSAWLVSCYSTVASIGGGEQGGGNTGSGTGTGTGTGTGNGGAGNSQTGDFGVIAAAIAMGISAICGTAVVAKKKEN